MKTQKPPLTYEGIIKHLKEKGYEEIEPGEFLLNTKYGISVKEVVKILKKPNYKTAIKNIKKQMKESIYVKDFGKRIKYTILFTNNYIVFMKIRMEGLEPKVITLKKSKDKITPSFEKKVAQLLEDIKNDSKWEKLFDRSDLIEEFHKLYLKARENLLNNIKGINDDTLKEEFTDNLLMQMLIIWYLQEKGFLNNDPNYLINMFNKHKTLGFNNYYDLLKELFNTMQKKPNQEIYHTHPKLGKIIATGVAPFITNLNDEEIKKAQIPDTVFYKKEATKKLVNTEPKNLKPEEVPILNLLESRDWTEGNIDKFVIGAIFEKLLTPEERKGKGAYYTPEIITKYISKNTIHPYLLDKINKKYNTNYKTLKEFFNKEKDIEKYEYLFNLLQNIKIIDPACGSGHFLESVIDTLVEIYSIIKQKTEEHKFDKNKFAILVADEQGNIHKKSLLDFNTDDEFIMNVKFHIIISKNIYGVDINKSAIHIARARLFLSIAEHFNTEKKTYIPFPNIHLNLRDGNTLIGFINLKDLNKIINTIVVETEKPQPKQMTIVDFIKTYGKKDMKKKNKNKQPNTNKTNSSIFDYLKKIDSFLANIEKELKLVDNTPTPKRIYRVKDKGVYKYDSILANELVNLLFVHNELNPENIKQLLEIKGKLMRIMLVSLNSSHATIIKKLIRAITKAFNNALNEELLNYLEKNEVKLSHEDLEKLGYFHWILEFPEVFLSGGFDIVLGNPPYVRQERINHIVEGVDYKKILSALYEPFDKKFDFSMYFILRSIQLLKEGGYHSFIITNKWLRAKYGKKMRKYLKENITMKKIIDFNGVKVFVGVTVDTMIYVLKKQKPTQHTKIFYSAPGSFLSIKSISEISDDEIHKIEEGGYHIKQFSLEDDVWNFVDEELLEIKKWIEKVGTPLKELDVNIFRGVVTGYNEAFIIDDEIRRRLIEEDSESEELIKPLLRGRDIGKYFIEWDKKWLIVIPSGFTRMLTKSKLSETEAEQVFRKEYPALYKHLVKFKDKLVKRYDQGEYWWELRECTYYQEFEEPKIVFSGVDKSLNLYYDNAGFYVIAPANIITPTNASVTKVLTLILNSSLIKTYFKEFLSTKLGSSGSRIYVKDITRIPVRPLKEFHPSFEILADYLLFLNSTKDRREEYKEVIEFFDKQITDSLVYELYFKEKFYEDGLYPAPESLLLDVVKEHLKSINYDSWVKLYWKKQLDGKLPKQEQMKMKELEQENLKTIMEVYNALKNNKKVQEIVTKIKSHRWVRIMENS